MNLSWYNYEINGIYYCVDNIIIDNGKVIDRYAKQPERYIILDYFIIDLEGETIETDGQKRKVKTIKLYDDSIGDSFSNTFKNIETIIVSNEYNGKRMQIIYDGGKKAELCFGVQNCINYYCNNYMVEVANNYMVVVKGISEFVANKLSVIGDNFLKNARNLFVLNIPMVKKMGNYCLRFCDNLNYFCAEMLEEMGEYCFEKCNELKRFEVDRLKVLRSSCLNSTPLLRYFSAKRLEVIETNCLNQVNSSTNIDAPLLQRICANSLTSCLWLCKQDFPFLTEKGENTPQIFDRDKDVCYYECDCHNKIHIFCKIDDYCVYKDCSRVHSGIASTGDENQKRFSKEFFSNSIVNEIPAYQELLESLYNVLSGGKGTIKEKIELSEERLGGRHK